MKRNLNDPFWAVVTGLLGGVTLLLRSALFLLGTDSKGLLMTDHPLNTLVWVVTAVAVVLVLAVVWQKKGSGKCEAQKVASIPAAVGAFCLAGCVAVTVSSTWPAFARLELFRDFAGFLTVPALVWVGVCHWRGRKPFFLFHGLVYLYFTLYAISHYLSWCSRPQIQMLFFSAAGILLLCMFAYYQTALDVNMGKDRMQLFSGLLGAFFCIAAMADGEDWILFAGGAVWALTNLRPGRPVSEETSHEAA